MEDYNRYIDLLGKIIDQVKKWPKLKRTTTTEQREALYEALRMYDVELVFVNVIDRQGKRYRFKIPGDEPYPWQRWMLKVLSTGVRPSALITLFEHCFFPKNVEEQLRKEFGEINKVDEKTWTEFIDKHRAQLCEFEEEVDVTDKPGNKKRKKIEESYVIYDLNFSK